MRRERLLVWIPIFVACSNGPGGHDARSESADPVATAAVSDSGGYSPDESLTSWVVDEAVIDPTSVPANGGAEAEIGPDTERPGVILRCEDGRINAYLVPDGGAGPGERDRVRIALDSVPSC